MTTTSKEKKTTSFDVSNYTVGTQEKTETVKIKGTGDSFEVTIKPLTWAKRNQLISRHLNWSSSGSTSFDGDSYVRDCLKEMITEAPWGKTTEAFLMTIDDRLGTALEEVVPKAFGTDDPSTGDKADQIKKG